jgi:hypothetical protein
MAWAEALDTAKAAVAVPANCIMNVRRLEDVGIETDMVNSVKKQQ